MLDQSRRPGATADAHLDACHETLLLRGKLVLKQEGVAASEMGFVEVSAQRLEPRIPRLSTAMHRHQTLRASSHDTKRARAENQPSRRTGTSILRQSVYTLPPWMIYWIALC